MLLSKLITKPSKLVTKKVFYKERQLLYEQMKAKIGEEKMKEYSAYDGGQETVMKSIEK